MQTYLEVWKQIENLYIYLIGKTSLENSVELLHVESIYSFYFMFNEIDTIKFGDAANSILLHVIVKRYCGKIVERQRGKNKYVIK